MASYFVSQSLVVLWRFDKILLPLRWVYTGTTQSSGRKTLILDNFSIWKISFLPGVMYLFLTLSLIKCSDNFVNHFISLSLILALARCPPSSIAYSMASSSGVGGTRDEQVYNLLLYHEYWLASGMCSPESVLGGFSIASHCFCVFYFFPRRT